MLPRFASSLATDAQAEKAEARCVEELQRQLDGAQPHLLLFFVTHHYGQALEGLSGRLREALDPGLVVGCTGTSVVGGDQEVERQPGLALWAAHLPGTSVKAQQISAQRDVQGGFTFGPRLPVDDLTRASVVLLADPFSFPVQAYLPRLAEEHPGVPVVGGQASGGQGPRQNLLWLDDAILDRGAVALVLEGDVEMCTAVSQGCRPVGEPLVITASRGPLIHKLRGRPAARVFFEIRDALSPADRQLFNNGAHIGLALDASKTNFDPEDFLVRNVMGLHPQEGAVAVGDDDLRVGQTVQFMVRDGDSATDELQRILSTRAEQWSPREPGEAGTLLFTCGGRGRHLFGVDHHDAHAIQKHLGPQMPLAGFFANGEIGPVGKRSFLHGFTASIALLRRRLA